MNTFFRRVLLSLLAYFTLVQTSSLKREKVYQDDVYQVYDVHAPHGTFRMFAPNRLVRETIIHGYINLKKSDQIEMTCIKLMMSSLYLLPTRTPKRILMIGLGIGVLPRALNLILKDSHLDVVEIDPRTLKIAQDYFFFKNSPPKLNVIFGDGYEYVMNLTSEKYDIIVLDAFMDISEETCAPEAFLSEKFVRKVKERLNSNGVYVVNSLPFSCSKYSYERDLLHSMFGNVYIGSIITNTITFAQKGRAPTKRQIKSRVDYYKKLFQRLDTDGEWILSVYKGFKRVKRNSAYTNVCHLFNYTFVDFFCSI